MNKAWQTRRTNEFRSAVLSLLRARERGAEFHRLLEPAQRIAERLAVAIGQTSARLPRGYELTQTRTGEPAIAFQGLIINASCLDALPTLELLTQFAQDLATGWLDELTVALGREKEFYVRG